MAVISNLSTDGLTLAISITERFDSSVYQELRRAYEGVGHTGCRYIVDLLHATYMDSSALGMLLQLREYAGGAKDAVTIRNAGLGIRDILHIANFNNLMTIE